MSTVKILVDALEIVLDTPACGKRSAGTWAAAEATGRAAILVAASDVPVVERIKQLEADLAWHKESLARHASKLASVWDGMKIQMRETLGHESGAEPFDDLQALLLELKAARIALAVPDRVTLTGHQLREALDYLNPDGIRDPEQLDSELTFAIIKHASEEGDVATGMCCWNDDDEGVFPLTGNSLAVTTA